MATEGPVFTESRSLGQLVSQVLDNLSLIVEKQIALAKQEVSETIRQALGVLKLFAPALAVALLFVIALIALLISLLAWLLSLIIQNNPLAALVVSGAILTIVFLAVTGALAYLGYKKLMVMLEHPMGNTIESLREDVEWAKRQLTPSER